MDGQQTSKTRKGDREIISVSLPLPLYSDLIDVCARYSLNRSALISQAIADRLRNLTLGGYSNAENKV